jgi:hypothetical protein
MNRKYKRRFAQALMLCSTFVLGTAGCSGGGSEKKCGNHKIDPGEQCDGTALNNATCKTAGDFWGGTLSCNDDCTLDTSACNLCGNGKVDPGEDCDGTNLNHACCATAGDFNSGDLRCLEDCKFNTSACEKMHPDCFQLNCKALNMKCKADGSACEGCLSADYTASVHHCYPSGATWGSPCKNSADCPGTGTPGVDTFCMDTTGGYCYQSTGPDYATEGEPCTGDSGSIAVNYKYQSTYTPECFKKCSADTDCRPGYTCKTDLGTASNLSACMPIYWKCKDVGCNDTNSSVPYYCEQNGSWCYEDACRNSPCQNASNSTSECKNFLDGYTCTCQDGFVWDIGVEACVAIACHAIDLGTFSGSEITRAGQNSCRDSCLDATGIYDPGTRLESCTQYMPQFGNEIVYQIILSAGVTVKVTVTPTQHFDASVYVITDCNDRTATTCTWQQSRGSDRGGEGAPETINLTNTESTQQTFFIVADSYGTGNCGVFDITIAQP